MRGTAISIARDAPGCVRDAFAAWRSQLDEQDAADKVLAALQPRRRHRSRAERVAQVEHAQQSTAASSLKRSAVAVAVDSAVVVAQEDSGALRLPRIETDKSASLLRRRQALADQASYAALSSYSPDLAPGLAFLARIVDAAAAGAPPFRLAPSASTALDGVRVYELPNFPVRVVPTLLRVRSLDQGRCTKEPLRWSMALVLCRDRSESNDDEDSTPSAVRGSAPLSKQHATSSKSQSTRLGSLTLFVRLYLPASQPDRRNAIALSSETRRALVRTLLSSWVASTAGAGYLGCGVRAVCKCAELPNGGATSRPSGTALRLLQSAEEVEKAIDAMCDVPNPRQKSTGDTGDTRESRRFVREADNNAREADDATRDSHGDAIDAIQPYIPSRSSTMHSASTTPSGMGGTFASERSAWIARCSFRKKEKNPSTVWILSGGGRGVPDSAGGGGALVAATVDEHSVSCQIVKCSSSQSWTEPRLLTAALAPELERLLRVSFKDLVVDFVQVSDGSWLLLQVKAFELRQQGRTTGLNDGAAAAAATRRTKSAPDRLTAAIAHAAQQYRKWRCAGRYCSSPSTAGDLSPLPEDSNTEASGYLSLKVLRSCEFVDDYYCRQDASLGGGFESFTKALAFHLQHELPKREVRQLYESQPLCSACMRRYYQLREQLDQAVTHESKVDAAVRGHGGRKLTSLANSTRQAVSTGTLNPARPRVLPALQTDEVPSTGTTSIYASISAPDLVPAPRERVKSDIQPTDRMHSSYLTEMEKLLAIPLDSKSQCLEPQHTDNDDTGRERRVRPTPEENQVSSDVYARIFSPEGQRQRVEAMWQSAAPKSLALDTHQPQETPDRIQQTYNTFSLASELRRLDNDTIGSNATPTASVVVDKYAVNQAAVSEARQVRGSHKTHQIRLTDCRSVFSDDEYRDRTVQEAVDAITDRGERVCFVVMPLHVEESDDQLADLALRSLFLDVKDAVTRSSADVTMTTTPQIIREASGCVTMTI